MPPSIDFHLGHIIVVLSEALPVNHELHCHHAVVLLDSPTTSPPPLLDQEGGDVPGLYVC